MEEQRRSPRFSIGQIVEVTFARERFLFAHGVNISEHGLLCEMKEPPELGARILLELEISKDSEEDPGEVPALEIEGMIVRADELEDHYHVGIEFLPLATETDRTNLKNLVERLKQ